MYFGTLRSPCSSLCFLHATKMWSRVWRGTPHSHRCDSSILKRWKYDPIGACPSIDRHMRVKTDKWPLTSPSQAPPLAPWQPCNPDAIFTPDYFFNRKKAAEVPMTFRTVDPVTSIPVAFFPHPTSRTPSPVHTVVCSPPAHTVARPLPAYTVAHLPPVFLDLKRLVDEDAKMSLNPFREHIPHLRRLPLPYTIKAQGNWKLHHYSDNLAPHI